MLRNIISRIIQPVFDLTLFFSLKSILWCKHLSYWNRVLSIWGTFFIGARLAHNSDENETLSISCIEDLSRTHSAEEFSWIRWNWSVEIVFTSCYHNWTFRNIAFEILVKRCWWCVCIKNSAPSHLASLLVNNYNMQPSFMPTRIRQKFHSFSIDNDFSHVTSIKGSWLSLNNDESSWTFNDIFISLICFHLGSKVVSNFLNELLGCYVISSVNLSGTFYENCQIFSHDSWFDRLDNRCLQVLGESSKLVVVVEFRSGWETSGPCEDRSDWVCWRFLSLLVLPVMSGNSSVGSFSFDWTIWTLKYWRHQTKRPIPLSNHVRLNITVIVFTGPYKSTLRLNRVSHHIINKSMLVPSAKSIKLRLIITFKNLSKNILKPTIILLQDGILGGHIHRVLPLNSLFKAFMSKTSNGIISVIHAHTDSWFLELEHSEGLFCAPVIWCESHFKLTRSVEYSISSFVLITKGMSSNNDGLFPSWYIFWNIWDKNWCSKNCTTQIISNGSIWWFPHLFKVEFYNSCLIGCDGGALYTYLMFSDCLGRIKSNLIISCISVLNA